MSDREGPWGRAEPQGRGAGAPSRKPPWRRAGRRPWLGLWALFLLALAVMVLVLDKAFPGALHGRGGWADVAYGLGFAAIVSAGLFRARGISGLHLKFAAIWVGVAAALALGFAYQDEVIDALNRLELSVSGGAPVRTGPHELALPEDDQGGYGLVGEVDGRRVRFLVDTGASETTLSPDDARRLGVDLDSLRYDRLAETANGVGRGAPFTAARLRIGPAVLTNVPMVINQAPMSRSLLGVDVLRRLGGFEVRGRTLVLKLRA